MNNQRHTARAATKFAHLVSDSVGSDLRSIILFGSTTTGIGHDFDLIFILRDSSDSVRAITRIRDIIAESPFVIDGHIVRESEITHHPFSLNTQGAYLLPILQKALVLHGDNPFLNISPTSDEIRADALRKIQHYAFRIRQAALGCNRTEKPARDGWGKFVRKCAYDVLVAQGIDTTFRDAPLRFATEWPQVIQPTRMKAACGRSPLPINKALPLVESIYAAAPRLLNLTSSYAD